jgi:hypothetical protein
MSNERKKRREQAQAQLQGKPSATPVRKIITGALIVAAFAVVIYLALHKRESRLEMCGGEEGENVRRLLVSALCRTKGNVRIVFPVRALRRVRDYRFS